MLKSKHWDFDDKIIFFKIDLFLKRLSKLKDLFSIINQF